MRIGAAVMPGVGHQIGGADTAASTMAALSFVFPAVLRFRLNPTHRNWKSSARLCAPTWATSKLAALERSAGHQDRQADPSVWGGPGPLALER